MKSKESKSMIEVRKWRKNLFAQAKGRTIGQNLEWISRHSKMLGRPYIDPLTRFKKAA